MTNIIGNSFGKLFAIAFLSTVFSVASYAQASANMYYQQGGAFYGTIYAYHGSHWEIYTNGTVIKTFKNSCRFMNGTDVLCTFGQFRNGQHIYSGQAYFTRAGFVYLRWTNENIAGVWRNINGGWIGFKPTPK